MSLIRLTAALAIVFCLLSLGCGQKGVTTTARQEDYLGEGLGWMDISNVEHTAEYLAKAGGTVGDPTASTGNDVRGNWTMELRDLRQRVIGSMRMELYQVGTVVYGYGTTSEGLTVTANGAIVENTLSLGAVTVPQVALYRLRLSLSPSTADGSFDAFNPSGASVSGSAHAEKEVARGLS